MTTIQRHIQAAGVEWKNETRKAAEREAIAKAILVYDKALASTIVSMWVVAHGYWLMSSDDLNLLVGEAVPEENFDMGEGHEV